MAEVPDFPMPVRMVYQRDNGVKASFLADVDAIAGDAKQRFEKAFGEIGGVIERSISSVRGNRIAFDIDLAGLRQTAASADFAAQRITAMRDAAISLARKTSDTSASTKSYLDALRAQTVEAERAKRTADAQVTTYARLQSEIDRTVAGNQRLAASYRTLFIEEAKASNFATRSQQAVNAGFAPGLNRQPKSARASAEVFASQSYAPKADVRSELDRFREGAASLDRAAVAATTLDQVLGRISVKGQAVGDALAAAGQKAEIAAQNQARAQLEAAKATDRYAAELEQVLRAIDPTRVAQQQLDAALDRADRAFAKGAISAREYGLAVNAAANDYQAMVQGAKRGTDANGNVINSLGAVRQASLQAGQQLQDIAISLYSGQQASVVFAQQLPQLAFGLTGLTESTRRWQQRLGSAATFLAGPWGLAVGLAVGAAATLITKLIGIGDEADKAKDKTYDFTKALDYWELGAKRTAEAMGQLASATRSAIAEQGDFLESEKLNADSAVRTIEERLERNQQALRKLKEDIGSFSLDPTEGIRRARQVGRLQGAIAEDRAALPNARAAQINAEIALSQRQVNDALDEATAAATRFKKAVGELNARRAETKADPIGAQLSGRSLSQDAYDREYKRLKTKLDAEQKAARDAERQSNTGARDLAQFGNPLPGARISSGYGHRSRPTAGASSNHLGIDYVAPIGTPVLAAMDGIVEFANAVNGYGNQVELRHGAGTATRYSHLSRFAVGDGDAVRKGQTIGFVGKTGVATGPHLHYEVLVNGKKVDPSKGQFPIDPTKVAEAAEQARNALQNLGNSASADIARINAQFDDQPRLIDQASAATRTLNGIIADLGAQNRDGIFDKQIASAKDALNSVGTVVARDIARTSEEMDQQYKIQTLILQGRDREAAVMSALVDAQRKYGDELGTHEAEIRRIAELEYERAESVQRAVEIQNAYLDATRSVRQEVEAILSGQGKFSNFKQIFKNLQGKILAEQLFGDVFRDLDKWVKEKTGIGSSVDALQTEVDRSGTALSQFTDAVTGAASQIVAGVSLGGATNRAANDNPLKTIAAGASAIRQDASFQLASYGGAILDPIAVQGTKTARRTVNDMTPESYFDQLSARMADRINKAFKGALPAGFTGALGGAFAGYAMGGNSTFGSVTGATLGALKSIKSLPGDIKGALGAGLEGLGQGSAIAGIGKSLGVPMSTTGAELGGLLFGPIGGIVGGLLGGALKKTKTGSATIGGVDGSLGVTGTGGSSGSYIKAATSSADGVISLVDRIAQQFGATVDASLGKVSIGIRDGKYRVDGSGSGITKTSKGAIDFGKDGAEAAARAAALDLIQDGVIVGLRQGVQVLLKAAKDLDKGLQDALDFQSVFDRLKAIKDPVGAALDTVDREFDRLRKLAEKAGEGMAEVEELYLIERTKAIDAAKKQMTASLQGLYDDLTIGDRGLSLRSRLSSAKAAYDPLKARVQAGDVTAYDDFAAAAQTLLGLSRELNGSQSGYFDLFSEIKTVTKTALDASTAIANASANRDSPFSNSAVPANDNSAVVTAIDAQTQAIVNALTQYLGANNVNQAAILAAIQSLKTNGGGSLLQQVGNGTY